MNDLTAEVRLSLSEAGIGAKFHDMVLIDIPHGAGMLSFLRASGKDIRGGQSVVFHDIGLRDPIIMLARALHIHGVGCKIVPLVHMRRIINLPEFREDVEDIDVLIIMDAQDDKRGNPLHDAVMAEVEYLIKWRHERGRATFLQWGIPAHLSPGELDKCYWSSEMLHFIGENFERVTTATLAALAK